MDYGGQRHGVVVGDWEFNPAVSLKVMGDLGLVGAPRSPDQLIASPRSDMTLNFVEAIHMTLVEWSRQDLADRFADRVNEVLLSHRLRFRFVSEDSEIVPLESHELHAEVVEPALRLLHGKPDFAEAHDVYVKALKEISDDDAADAITDAGTALQKTLEALGCSGNALGPLSQTRRRRAC